MLSKKKKFFFDNSLPTSTFYTFSSTNQSTNIYISTHFYEKILDFSILLKFKGRLNNLRIQCKCFNKTENPKMVKRFKFDFDEKSDGNPYYYKIYL